MNFDAYRRFDAIGLAAEVACGRVTPAHLLDLALARLDAVQPRLNPVSQRLEAMARAQLEEMRQGPLHGPLAGVPFLVKDFAQHIAGVRTLAGSRACTRLPPASVHSHTVRRFLSAGAVLFGKTNTPELALKGVTDPLASGRSSNPWNPARTCGGSSGGSAAAIAAGVVPMAGANDGGGSIRIPAACCGLMGLKPSRGRVSDGPHAGGGWFGANSQGAISRSVRDSALALDLLSGPEPGDPFALPAPTTPFLQRLKEPLRRLRIGWSVDSPIGTPVHPEAQAAVAHAVDLLQRHGHHCEPAAPAINGAMLADAYLRIYFGAVPAAIDDAVAQGAREADFEPLTRVVATLGRQRSAVQFAVGLQQWDQFAQALGAFHQRFDLFLTPTLASPPIPHGTGDPPPWQLGVLGALRASGLLALMARRGWLDGAIEQIARDNLTHVPFTQLANLTGTPSMSLPLHWTADGLPLGVQFTGRPADEATLLQLAAEMEAAQPWFDRLPDQAPGQGQAQQPQPQGIAH